MSNETLNFEIKHYLLLLKEYLVGLGGSVKAQSKSSLNLEEIQKIFKELSQLNENFII